MKILFKTEYFKRIIYVIEINNKVGMFYKSSGLSGTGHEGQLLPFMYLEDRAIGMIGHIYKEMFYDGLFQHHRKRLNKFPGASEKVNQICKLIKANDNFEIDELKSPEHMDPIVDAKKFIKSINDKLDELCKDKEFFDLKHDIVQ